MSLHKTQEKLLEILTYSEETPLTMREICELLGLSSPSLVHHHIVQLEKKGFLKRNPNNPSDYQILTCPEEPIVFLNLYGSAKCGPDGTILSGNPTNRIPLSTRLLTFSADQAFLIKAEGDSMIPEIKNEDIVIAKKQQLANDGDIIVCSLDSEVRIKKFRRFSNTEYILESLNPVYNPIFVKDGMSFKIEGIFKGLIRR